MIWVFDTSTSEIDSDASDLPLMKNKLAKNSSRVKVNQRNEKAISREMIKCNFIYYPETEMPELASYNNCYIAIHIEKDYFFPQNNQNLYSKKLWGTEFYHYKSDVVLMVFHAGKISLESLKSPKVKGFVLICHVSKRKNFKESTMNGITSQKLSGQDKDGYTLKPIQLDPVENFEARILLFHADKLEFKPKCRTKAIPRYIAPHNPLSLYCCKFNKLNDLSIEYSLQNICDKSSKKEEFLSCLLEDYDMLIENVFGKKLLLQFKQISQNPQNNGQILYVLSEVLRPLANDRDTLQFQIGRDESKALRVLMDGLKWNEIVWDQTQMTVRGTVFSGLDNISFFRRNELQIDLESERE